jgi:PhnB protein
MGQLHIYLNFPGNCREAMTFYQQCLGGELNLITHEGSPMADQLPEAARKSILHANLVNGPLTLLASDGMGEVTNGNSVNLSLDCVSEAEIDELFPKLAAGGQVTMPLGDQFWGAKFGMLTDKFGIHWLLNYDRPKA